MKKLRSLSNGSAAVGRGRPHRRRVGTGLDRCGLRLPPAQRWRVTALPGQTRGTLSRHPFRKPVAAIAGLRTKVARVKGKVDIAQCQN